MKTLSLLRHAKSSWDDPVQRDFDRPLNRRGHRAARTMGQWIAHEGLVFDTVLASSAKRVEETLAGVAEGRGAAFDVQFDRRIYMASSASLFELLHAVPDSASHVLLVGHNPGLEELLLEATRNDGSPLRDEAEQKYPTATFATLEFAADRWADVDEGGAKLLRFVRPRDLDAELGPEE